MGHTGDNSIGRQDRSMDMLLGGGDSVEASERLSNLAFDTAQEASLKGESAAASFVRGGELAFSPKSGFAEARLDVSDKTDERSDVAKINALYQTMLGRSDGTANRRKAEEVDAIVFSNVFDQKSSDAKKKAA